jgi:hypothetical protein
MEGLALGVRRTAGIFQEFAGNALISIGTLVEKGGKLLKVFGVEVVASTGESIRQYGEQLVAKSQTTLTNATTAFQAGMKRLSDLRSSIRQKDENAEIKSTNNVANANKKAADEVKASHLDLEIARQKASAATNELLQKTAEALRKQNEELRGTDTEWGKNHTTVTNYLTSIKDLLPPVENLRDEIERNNAALKRNAETAKEAKQHFKDTVNEAVQIGRGLIDAAQAAGAMNSEMGSVLNSVLSIGESLASLSVDFSAGGLVGVIGGIANVVSAIGGSNKGVREALDSNRAALDRLSREVGNFNLGASGKTFSATEKAIAATEAAVREGRISGAGRESQARNLFRKELLKQGVSVKDAEALLEELGFGGALKGDEEFFASIKRGQLGQGLRDTEFGQFGRDFESQFRATTEGFGIHGTDKGGQLSELAALAGRFSPALKAALSSGDAKSALSGLFDQLKTGGLDAAAFGDLNANQFLDLLKSLLSLLDEGAVIPGDSEFTGGTKGKGFEIPIGGGLPRIPPLVPDDFGGIDPGFLTSLGRLSIPGLALPSFSTDLTSSLGAGKSAVGGGDSFTQQIAQNIQGDLINQYNITPRDGVDPEEIAEIVAQRLGERYSLQKQALGLG